jgi:acyl-CoA synthetase (AMP-forming)/AMP-acid ligase II/thioesterase domain-containing protein/acyl carrier protein
MSDTGREPVRLDSLRALLGEVDDSTTYPGAAPAILAPGRAPLTYSGLERQINSTRASLTGYGIARGDRVAIVAGNGPAMATTFLGVIAGAACAPLNPAYTADELRFYLTDLQPATAVVSSDLDTPAREVARSLGIPVVELRDEPGGVAGLCTFEPAAPSVALAELAPAQRDDVALLLHTSGTTSRPKLVPLTHGNLGASSRSVAQVLRLGSEDRTLNLMPLFHIHGLVAALLSSLVSGGSVACTPGFQAAHVLGWIRELQPTWYSAVPSIHQAMLAAVAHAGSAPRSFRLIRSSSAALPTPVLEELERTFGVPVIEAYGMTEAAHQIASNPLPPANHKPGTVGRASGPDVGIMDAEGRLLDSGAVGEVVLRGPNLTAGYLGDPALNEAAFTDGWFRTGDQGFLDVDDYLTITGRLKELINRGGEKIAPSEVEEALVAHPDVARAVAFAVPHQRLGEDVGAAVVLREGGEVSRGELRRFVAGRLAPFKIPRSIVFLDEIPTGPTGKQQRIGLAERLGLDESPGPRGAEAFVGPRDEIEQQLAAIFADVLQLDEPVSINDDFIDLGADSLHFEELLGEIDRVFHRQIPATLLLSSTTVEQLAGELRTSPASEAPASIVPIQPDGSRPPLFCLLRAGDLVTTRHFVPALGTDQPIMGIWMPTMHGTRDAAGGIEDIASTCVRAVRDAQPEGPYYLFGHSLGGIVVYEMARQIRADGGRVGLVVLADSAYPRGLRLFADRIVPRVRIFLSPEGSAAVRRRARRITRRLRGRPDVPRASSNAEQAEYEYVAGSAEPLDEAEAVRREHRWARDPRPAGGPVVVLRTQSRSRRGPYLGWDRYVSDDWEAHDVPGSHRSMLGEPYVHELAAILADCLRRAQDGARDDS